MRFLKRMPAKILILVPWLRHGLLRTKFSWIAASALPPVVYLIVWSFLKDDAMARIGYLLWRFDWASNDLVNSIVRMLSLKVFLNYVFPLVLFIIGLGWKIIFSIKPKAVNPPNG